MTSNSQDFSATVTGLAARLRLLQVDCADAAPAVRQEYVAEEINRALKGLSGEKRKEFLTALAEQFPVGEAGARPAGPINDNGRLNRTPEALLEQFLQIIPELDVEQKERFTQQLMEAGLMGRQPATGAWPIAEEIQQALNLAAGQTVSPESAMSLLALLVPEFHKLDAVVWETWSKLAPRSAIRRETQSQGDVKSLGERWLQGDPEVDPQQVQNALEKTRKLVAGLLAAIQLGGKAFAEEYMVRFLPRNIEDVAHSRGMSLFGESLEKKCWNKYKELAYGDAESIEKKVRDAIAKYTEEIVKKI